MLHGRATEWHPNGRLHYKWRFRHGKITGKRIEFDERGLRRQSMK